MEQKRTTDHSDNNNNSDAAAGESSSTPFGGGVYVDTSKSDRAIWLMKCPPLVSKSLSSPRETAPLDHSIKAAGAGLSSSYTSASPVVAKVVLSIDPLLSSDQQQSPQVGLFLRELPPLLDFA